MQVITGMHTELPIVTLRQYFVVQIVFLLAGYILNKVEFFSFVMRELWLYYEEMGPARGFIEITI